MITQSELETLAKRPNQPGYRTLSVYLNVDPASMVNRNRGYERALEGMLRAEKLRNGSADQRQQFQANVERIRQFIAGYVPTARSLMMLSAQAGAFFWWCELHIPIPNAVHWCDSPYLKPVLEALDEYERFVVILVNKRRGRILTVVQGEVEDRCEIRAANDVKHFRRAGSDRRLSQTKFQRQADLHALWHLKKVAAIADRLADQHAFQRLLLAGTPHATGALKEVLSKRLLSRWVASFTLPVDASEREILDAAMRLEEKTERAGEAKLVQDLEVSARKTGAVALGLNSTLLALERGQVRKLVYGQHTKFWGSRCPVCSRLYGDVRSGCGYCNASLQPVADFTEAILERALQGGAEVEQVRGEAEKQMKALGGIGAMLRFRSSQVSRLVSGRSGFPGLKGKRRFEPA